ncbi:hypothetical protein G5I_11632 [Acromyrmex echinatior]|uniref:Secreted protein n=1 Tax=Acromyrmex echinatior TaxID=103372 RepID=F4X047_ACREC|nr:hypothetical protein G5I_11632 [Acromyrmex echinatior]
MTLFQLTLDGLIIIRVFMFAFATSAAPPTSEPTTPSSDRIAEDVYDTPNESFKTLVKQSLQTQQVCEKSCINWGHWDKNT